MRPSDTATLARPASRWLPAEELSVARAGPPPQDRRFSALRHPNLLVPSSAYLEDWAFPLLPRSFWYSPFLMIHDTTSSELNNNLGFAIHLGLDSLHERFFSLLVTVFESQALRSFPPWPCGVAVRNPVLEGHGGQHGKPHALTTSHALVPGAVRVSSRQ